MRAVRTTERYLEARDGGEVEGGEVVVSGGGEESLKVCLSQWELLEVMYIFFSFSFIILKF